MIIECKSCSRKFQIKDEDIPENGRMVKCGYCSVEWFQFPIKTQDVAETDSSESVSKMEFEASDGRMYRFMGSQWAELLRSGKTGLLAKRTIAAELNRRAGIIKPKKNRKKIKEAEGTIDPSKVERATDNAVIGNVQEVAQQIIQRFNKNDKLMCWFDFFNHDSERVQRNMKAFMNDVVPIVNGEK